MKLNLSTENLARASARHGWLTIGAWLAVLVVAMVLVGTLLGDALTTEETLTNNPESVQADNLLHERLGESNNTIDEIAIVRSTTLTVDDPAYRSYVEELYGDLTALGNEVIAGGTHYYLTGDESLVSADRHTTFLPLVIPEGARGEINQVHQVVDEANESGSFQVLVTGEATLEVEINEIAEKDLLIGEGIGISVALLVLALVFGTIAAAFLPIVLSIAAIVVALGATALVGQALDLPFFVTNMITMIGLAVGIDYSLFIVSRYREERAKGLDKVEAIAAAGATAGRTVLVSGMTVVLALTGLLITPHSGLQSIGAGAILVVIAAMLASMTLLPAVLGLMGDRINAIRIPLIQRRKVGQPAEASGGFWDWTTRAVMRRPVVSVVLSAGLLVAAAVPYFDINLGATGVSALPDSLRSKEAFIVLQEEFGFGMNLPAVVVIDGRTDSESVVAAIKRLEAAVASDPAFVTSELEVFPEADLSILSTQLAGDPASTRAMDAVERLRSDYIPGAFDGVPASAMVTGETAGLVDLTDAVDTYTPIVFALVLGLSFVLLTVAFRSIVIPVKAILMNLLSVGATYGLLVLVFQKGVGADLLGFQQVDVIETGLPLFLFAILFGLSMDYHVFLLSRIRERFVQTGDNNEAVAFGLRSTGRLITGAALIMVAVFGGFAMGDLVGMQQFGFGLAVAIFLDATIVRSILVPASMTLLGDWNWYLPNWLEWLPRINMEGAQLDEPPAQTSAPVSVPVFGAD
ncbi:MAG: MMPL family transporter [Chloroflexi bacterium]|nr:MMPL family transporter [Chloroflexota bacterium]